MRTLYDGVAELGLTPWLPASLQGPVIVNVHAPADPAWNLQAFVDALKSRGFLISNFYSTPTPTFRVGCIGAITPADMAGAVRAIDAALREIGITHREAIHSMNPDLAIARAAKLQPIQEIADKLGIPADAVDPYGRFKAKIGLDFIDSLQSRPDGALVLVTGINPTPAGEGKTTTTVGLGDALNRIGKRAVVCLREPSLGPSFGMKGGAAGGGYAQVVPMDQINLHFTGDFHAITSANNLLAAMVDNSIYWGNPLNLDPRRITWRRCLDMNDRALRHIVGSLGGVANGFPREDGFDITVASEVMAVFCLARNLHDLQGRLGRMIVGQTRGHANITAADLKADGAMAVLLRDAIAPNLVQTLEGTPGAGAWRSVRQHRAWLQLGDGDAAGAEAGRCGGDRGGVRRRSGRGEIPRHQMPFGRPEAVLRGGCGERAGAEDAWRRAARPTGAGECRGGEARRRQLAAACREHAEIRPAGGGRGQSLQAGYRCGVRRGA